MTRRRARLTVSEDFDGPPHPHVRAVGVADRYLRAGAWRPLAPAPQRARADAERARRGARLEGVHQPDRDGEDPADVADAGLARRAPRGRSALPRGARRASPASATSEIGRAHV